jgi:hypothetical protein
MLIMLLAWMYISFICLIWGNMLLDGMKKIAGLQISYEVPVICMAGLSITGTLALYLSLFVPLDWKPHLVVILPAIIYCFLPDKRTQVLEQINSVIHSFAVPGYCLLAIGFLMLLAIGSYNITHLDTLNYHAQSIQWLERYKAVPGLVHLKLQLGFQSLWFAGEAIFSPATSFLKPTAFFLNGAVLCWYFIFVVSRISPAPGKQPRFESKTGNKRWGWVLLLSYTMISWMQVRLTAASASPDFIVSLYILAAIYLYIQSGTGNNYLGYQLLVSILFCCTAFVIKLSAIAILILALMILIRFIKGRQFKLFFLAIAIFSVVIIPFLARNVISTGYPLYPSSIGNVFHVDWKLSEQNLGRLQQYITEYAKLSSSANLETQTLQIPFSSWFSPWWGHLAIVERVLLFSILAGIVFNLIFLKSFIAYLRQTILWQVLMVVSGGILLWFVQAPDLRFGTGYLIGMVYILYSPLVMKWSVSKASQLVLVNKAILIGLFVSISIYTTYRFTRFYKPGQIIYPIGIEKVEYVETVCNKIRMNRLKNKNNFCGSTPVPCIRDSCATFSPRGASVSEGFKAP